MSGDRIGETLRALPRERAREGFTRRVLDRLPEEPHRRRPVGRLVLAAAALGVLLIGLPAAVWRWEKAQRSAEVRQELEALRAEKSDLDEEMEIIRRFPAEGRPMLYLGGDEDVDLVLDLGRMARRDQRPEGVPVGFQPAGPSPAGHSGRR